MAFKTYKSEGDIPAEFKKEYKKVIIDGEETWIPDLDSGAVSAVADAEIQTKHAGLLKNRDELKTEKEREEALRKGLQQTLDKTERDLSELRVKMAGGHTVTAEDVALLTEVQKLVTLSENEKLKDKVVNILKDYPTLNEKFQKSEVEKKRSKLAKILKWDEQQLNLHLENPALNKDLDFEFEKVTVEGQDEPQEKAFAVVGGKRGAEFSEYVASNPNWKLVLPSLKATNVQEGFDVLEQDSTTSGERNVKDPVLEIRKQYEQSHNTYNPLTGEQPKGAAKV